MVKIDGINKVRQRLERMRRRGAEANASVSVGYTQRYALAVHEAQPGDKNPPKSDAQRKAMFASMREREKTGHVPWSTGSPKYLEGPARRLASILGSIIANVYKKTKNMSEALLEAGLRLQRESQEEVPVDLGPLKASAFTEKDR